MTSQHDPDVRIRAFFQEGPAELSPRLLAEDPGRRPPDPSTGASTSVEDRLDASNHPVFATLGAVVLGLGALVVVGPGGHVAPSAAPTVAPSLAPSRLPVRPPRSSPIHLRPGIRGSSSRQPTTATSFDLTGRIGT